MLSAPPSSWFIMFGPTAVLFVLRLPTGGGLNGFGPAPTSPAPSKKTDVVLAMLVPANSRKQRAVAVRTIAPRRSRGERVAVVMRATLLDVTRKRGCWRMGSPLNDICLGGPTKLDLGRGRRRPAGAGGVRETTT